MGPSKGFIRIPIDVLSHTQLSDLDKLVFGVVWGLTWQKGYCYARNRFIGDILGKHPNTISTSISKLAKLDYINANIDRMDGNTRKITVNQDKVSMKTLEGLNANGEHEYNTKYIGNRKENSFPSKISIKDTSPKGSGGNEAEEEFVKWFCEDRGIKGFPNHKRQLEAVRKCFEAGYSLDDLKGGVKKLADDPWWAKKGFDILDLANQLPKLIKNVRTFDPDLRLDNPPWIGDGTEDILKQPEHPLYQFTLELKNQEQADKKRLKEGLRSKPPNPTELLKRGIRIKQY